MADTLTDAQKYSYIKQKYGSKAEKILNTYGAYAYEIDKYISAEKNPDKAKRLKSNFSNGFMNFDFVKVVLKNHPSFKSENKTHNEIKKSVSAYKNAEKISYIKQKYGAKADVMLKTYGPMAYDIDKNFSDFYNKKVFLGRNFWMNQTESRHRSELGLDNQRLFEQGKLPYAEAARIINCPAYFGTMQMTIDKISAQVKSSAKEYNKSLKPAQKKRQPQVVRGYQAQQQTQTQTQTQTQAQTQQQTQTTQTSTQQKQAQNKKRAEVKRTLKNQKQITETVSENPALQIKSVKMARLDTKLAEFDASKIKINVPQIKSPAEQKYDELIARKTADMSNTAKGTENAEIGLTLGDLMELGVDPIKDIQNIIKTRAQHNPEDAQKLIPEKGFVDKDTVVCKELALAAIAQVQLRDMAKTKKNKRSYSA